MSEETQPTTSPGALLADSLYGTPKVEEPEVTDEVIEESQEETPEIEAKEDSEVEGPDEGEEVEIRSFAELAEHYELDPEWADNLEFTEKVNGKEVKTSLAEMRSVFRKTEAADDFLNQAKAKAKEITEAAGQKKEALASSAAVFGKLVEQLEERLTKATKETDWAKLREEDPAEYAARKDEARENQQWLDRIKSEAQNAAHSVTSGAMQDQMKTLEEKLPEQREIFLERIPEWKDDDKAATERADLVKYLSDEGYSEQDINVAAYNGKLLALTVKAMRYDRMKNKSEVTKKKVVKAPKILKPGPSKAKPKPNGKAQDAASILYG